MNNLVTNITFALLSIFFFCCERPSEPTPQSGSGTRSMAESSTAGVSAAMQVGGTTPKRNPPSTSTEWRYVYTATLPMYKGLKLTSPFAIVGEHEGDISWGADGGCYYAINTETMPYATVGIADVKSLTPAYLNTLQFYSKGGPSWAPAGSAFWTNHMPIGTIIAYKTPIGKFILIKVMEDFPLTLEIYHENTYNVY